MKNLFTSLIFLLSASFGFAEEPTPPYVPEDHGTLIVNNRILARIGNKTISVLDVMKKMEVTLARSYPHLADSALARYQFFSGQWKSTLNHMIDTELMMEDAEKVELKISDADIREQMHERFGPNIMPTLDKLGISYDEAWQMLYSENAVQRMTWYRVNSKGVQSIGPKQIKDAYKKHCLLNPAVETWKYQVLSIRAPNEQLGAEAANRAYEELLKDGINFSIIAQKAKELLDNAVTFNVSEDYIVTGKELSESHKSILTSLQTGSYSKPVMQVSRFDRSIVHRIFNLKEHTTTKLPTFEEMSEQLFQDLVQEAVDRESKIYLTRLREKFGYDEKHFIFELPTDFAPFTYKQ